MTLHLCQGDPHARPAAGKCEEEEGQMNAEIENGLVEIVDGDAQNVRPALVVIDRQPIANLFLKEGKVRGAEKDVGQQRQTPVEP